MTTEHWWNDNDMGKRKYWELKLPQPDINLTWTDKGSNPGVTFKRPATGLALSHGRGKEEWRYTSTFT